VCRTLIAVTAVLAAAMPLDAQQLRGVVSDASGAPVPGVLLQLLDSASRVVAQGLSGDHGAYRLRAPVSGAFVVRSLRIGFRPTFSEPLRLDAASDLAYDVTLTGIAIHLDTVRVSGRATCRIAQDTALQSFRALEQARSAIIATSLPDASARWSVTSVLFERIFDTTSVRPVRQRHEWWSGVVKEPWKSVPSDSLHSNGYIVGAGDSVVYRAPGLDALASDDFLEDHCFRLAASANPAEIGIAFEPSPARRKTPEISGTLWLDRTTAQLQRLTYGYVNAPLRAQERSARGELHFARVSNGGWVITRWSVHMPSLELSRPWRLTKQRLAKAPPELVVSGYREVGGELMSVSGDADTLWRHTPVTISGVVADSTGNAVPGARVVTEAAERGAVADSYGRFAVRSVLPGDLALEVHTAALDSLSTFVRSSATIFDSTSDLDLRIPTPESVVRAMCGSAFANSSAKGGTGIALVSLTADYARANLSRAKATIEWLSPDGTPHWVDARPDREGIAHFCGVPVRQTLILSASVDTIAAPTAQLRIPDDRRVVRTEMVLDPTVKVGAIFTGAVVRDSTNDPVPGAEVVIPELKKSQTTSERGLYRLRDIPAGAHRVIVRKMGYGPVDTTVAFRAGETMQRRIVLGRVTALPEVVVTTSAAPPDPRMRDFEENRRVGLGHFLTRNDLDNIGNGPLQQALAQLPGLAMAHNKSGSSAMFVTSARGVRSLGNGGKYYLLEGDTTHYSGCYAAVYLDNVPLFWGKEGSEVPDINRFTPSSLEAVEYYASGAQTPTRYSTLNSQCGVLVLHTRRPQSP
jgi:hypothetical protein